jgi:transcriptional regulator with XRE-family HTH domain
MKDLIYGRAHRELRLAAGLTAVELSEALGISAQFISMVENGVKHYSPKIFKKLKSTYGVTLSQLVTIETERHTRLVESIIYEKQA